MNTPDIAIGYVSDVFAKQMHFKLAGDVELGHSHKYSHMTLLVSGELCVTLNDIDTVFVAPHIIYIEKDKIHKLTALKDNTIAYCIHALRDIDGSGDIVDVSMFPKNTPLSKTVESFVNT